jgi:predicted alpha/beta hydrolase
VALHESAVGIPHEEIRIAMRDGAELSAWYVPSRNGAPSCSATARAAVRGASSPHVRMLARHGYGVLALDNPGNGESDGHSNGLGDNAQPAIAAGLDYLARRPDVDPRRIAGFGLSLGGEVLLDARRARPSARGRRLRRATRPVDGDKARPKGRWRARSAGSPCTRSAPSPA